MPQAFPEFPDFPLQDERLARLALHLVAGVGPKVGKALIGALGSARAVWEATREALLEIEGVGPSLVQRLAKAKTSADLAREWALLQKHDATFHTIIDPDYPEPLAAFEDAPMVLYEKGGRIGADRDAVAIVGSRGATPYGMRMTKRIAQGLAEAGFTVVSGLARGIDACAHQAALDAGGRTIGVLGNGLSRVYPPEHVKLAEAVCDQGALLAEADMGCAPQAGLFPARNRIISGISRAVVVIEAALKSGTLHTATHAAEQGIPVLAVPGPADSPLCEGTHNLIRQGAHLCTSAADVVALLGEPGRAPVPKSQGVPQSPTDPLEILVWKALESGPLLADELVRITGLSVGQLAMVNLGLEMRGVIRRLPGNRYAIPD